MHSRAPDRQLRYIQVARELFLEHGYAHVSMQMIASAAGGSKATLYSYFPSKAGIFRAFVLKTGEEKFSRLIDTPVNVHQNVGQTLHSMADAYLALACDPTIWQLNQLVIAEGQREPQLTRLYRNLTHVRTLNTLAWTFERLISLEAIRNADPHVLARHFKALLDCAALDQQFLHTDVSAQAHLQQTIRETVRAFLFGYQPATTLEKEWDEIGL